MKQKEGDEMSALIPGDLRFWHSSLCDDQETYFNAPVKAVRELIERIAALEAQAATAIAMRDLEERNKIDFIQQLERSEEQNRQMEAMRTHCENCGADYMATGIEAGCPCLLQARNRQLREAVAQILSLKLTTTFPGWDDAMSFARAALAATEPKP